MEMMANPTRARRGGWRRLPSKLAAAAVVCAAGGCSEWCHHPPPVTAVEVVPHLVFVGPGPAHAASFELEARLWTGPSDDRRSIADLQGYPLQWTSSQPSWLKVSQQQGQRVVMQLVNGYPDVGAEAIVTASVGGMTSSPGAQVIVVTSAAASGNDTANAEYAADLPPDAVVVNGIFEEGGSCAESLSALVRTSLLGQVRHDCMGSEATWGISVLATDHAVVVSKEGWTPQDDPVDVGSLQGDLRTLPVALWIAVGPDGDPSSVADIAKADVELANTILTANRAGILLEILNSSTITDPAEIAAIGGDCQSANDLTVSRKPGVLNVYYIDGLAASERGEQCGWREEFKQPAVYISANNHDPITLVHEMGHALSLVLPGAGHSNILPGFDHTNVMTSGAVDNDPTGRIRFSVGQVFRMNVDSSSWLNWATKNGLPVREQAAPRLACQCGANGEGKELRGPCPRLVDDVALPSEGPGEFHPWDCYDEIHLKGTDLSQDTAVALLAGRRWRSPLGTCTPDLPGRLSRYFGSEMRFLFENVTSPGSCPSWAAIFFKKHGVMYLPLQEQLGDAWWDSRNERVVFKPVPKTVEVPVHVYYAPATKPLAEEDSTQASKTFGESNWTGILLKFAFDETSSISETGNCLPSVGTAGEINVYYVVQSDPLFARLNGKDAVRCASGPTEVIVVSAGPVHSATTMAHYLGQAFGLVDASMASGFNSTNLMSTQTGGQRSELTLGQVFRMTYGPDSWVNRKMPATQAPSFQLTCTGAEAQKCPGLHTKAPD